MYCGEQTAVKRENEGILAVSLRCRAWTCPDCADIRKKGLMAQAIGGSPRTFLTLTTRRDENVTPHQAALATSRAWRLLRLRIIRHYRLKRLPFLAVMEPHVSGWPHLHIMLRMPYVPWAWLRDQWEDITGSRGVRIEHIDNQGRVAKYVAPYCSKCAVKIGTAKRYWQSQDYDLRTDKPVKQKFAPGEGWELWFKPLNLYLADHITLGHTVVSQSSRVAFIHLDTS